MDQMNDETTGVVHDMRHRLTNHPPQNGTIAAALDSVTEHCIDMSDTIIELVPPGRERSLALTKLEELSMWMKAGIARNQDAFVDEPDDTITSS